MDEILNIVLPVFGIILAGYLSRYFNLLDGTSSEALNRFVYYIALPPLLFLSTARVPLQEMLNWPFIAAYLAGLALTLVIAIGGAWLLFSQRDLATLTLHGMAAIFANTVYMGIPLFLAAFGPQRTTPILVAALVSNLVLIAAVIICVEFSQSSGGHYGKIFKDVGGALVRSPILIPLLLGLLASGVRLWIPKPIENFLSLLAGTTGPAALFALGLSLYGHSFSADVKEVAWLVFVKLLLNPLITWWLVNYVIVLDGFWASSAVLIAAIPTGALVFVFAQRYGVYVQRSAAVVMTTTMLSIITLSALLAWYGTG